MDSDETHRQCSIQPPFGCLSCFRNATESSNTCIVDSTVNVPRSVTSTVVFDLFQPIPGTNSTLKTGPKSLSLMVSQSPIQPVNIRTSTTIQIFLTIQPCLAWVEGLVEGGWIRTNAIQCYSQLYSMAFTAH